jgi:hypothetical protein
VTDTRDETYWRERADQLQHALSSRVLVEQAKGMLAERFGLEVDTAFELLRYAARGAQMKIRDLASEVVTAEQTPHQIIEALARHRAVLSVTPRVKRIAQNEQFFRAINEEIGARDSASAETFVCECGDLACHETLTLSRAELQRLHERRDLFAVLPGHEIPEVERVVVRTEHHLVVEKVQGNGTGDEV